jgi:hypothetical protein
MSIKSRILAATAALTVVGGLGTVGALSASAATPSCGHRCIDIFSREFGTHHSPNSVLDVWRGSAKAGTPIILYRTSNTDKAEDFNVSFQGTVKHFFNAGLVSSALNLHYSHNWAFEFEYTPNGVGTDLCIGVASTAVNGTPVVLVPCGSSARSVWVVDSQDSIGRGYVPLINGSDTNFSHPFVLSYPGNGFPTDKPRPQLQVKNLTGFSHGIGTPIGSVDDTQLWGADFGVLR